MFRMTNSTERWKNILMEQPTHLYLKICTNVPLWRETSLKLAGIIV